MTKKTTIDIRKPYDQPSRVTVSFPTKSRAKQSFKDECNINTIMAKYQKTGLIDHVQAFQGAYGDFTHVPDYQLSLNQVIAAQEAFDALPSSVRKRFNNNPGQLLEFLEDPKNDDESVRLGLRNPSPPQPKEEPPAPRPEPPAGGDQTVPKASA